MLWFSVWACLHGECVLHLETPRLSEARAYIATFPPQHVHLRWSYIP